MSNRSLREVVALDATTLDTGRDPAAPAAPDGSIITGRCW